jgi:hypothetical protein
MWYDKLCNDFDRKYVDRFFKYIEKSFDPSVYGLPDDTKIHSVSYVYDTDIPCSDVLSIIGCNIYMIINDDIQGFSYSSKIVSHGSVRSVTMGSLDTVLEDIADEFEKFCSMW